MIFLNLVLVTLQLLGLSNAVKFDFINDFLNFNHFYKNTFYEAVTQEETAVVQLNENWRFPSIKIFATGGTIASSGDSSTSNAGYSVNLTINDLVDNIPELSNLATVAFQQIYNVGSNEITSLHTLKLRNEILSSLKSGEYHGIVVTHGTDTLEETAFFLELTLDVKEPICLTGSMRPRTSISYDGLMNLYTSVLVASHESAVNRGVLVSLNDRIISGIYATKSNSNSLDTFKNDEQGTLGMFVDNQINWFISQPFKHRIAGLFAGSRRLLEIEHSFEMPEVLILFGYQSLNVELIELAVNHLNVKGIVLAGTGSGSWTDHGNMVLKRLSDTLGLPVIYSTRNANGIVPVGNLPNGKYKFQGAIAGGYLNPQKARILLQLCLIEGYSHERISEIFKLVYGGSRF
ncbi:asparaginase [Saccharomycopsis crataegensis]|uniref:asparaginase n=1 Tax=Saccharomycopsis crataegensis TaxID=43959 RepID=A0AAV5QP66_9ASCO|nr:asparaginase [Saccharomycopsis crataegensis]